MRITVLLMVLISAVMMADVDQRWGIEGDAFVNGQSDWEGYFTIVFTEAGTQTILHIGTYINQPLILIDYYYQTWETVDMYCTYYHPDTVAPRAYRNYYGITGNCPITEQDIYFRYPTASQLGTSGDVLSEIPVFDPEILSLDGATWAEIKALDF